MMQISDKISILCEVIRTVGPYLPQLGEIGSKCWYNLVVSMVTCSVVMDGLRASSLLKFSIDFNISVSRYDTSMNEVWIHMFSCIRNSNISILKAYVVAIITIWGKITILANFQPNFSISCDISASIHGINMIEEWIHVSMCRQFEYINIEMLYGCHGG